MAERFWIETLGCPKNQVDSDKIAGSLLADGLEIADGVDDADLVVVNTCAFVESAREESVDTILSLSERIGEGEVGDNGGGGAGERQGANGRAGNGQGAKRLVVTGCMAERYGSELAEALPEVDAVVGFGVPVNLGKVGGGGGTQGNGVDGGEFSGEVNDSGGVKGAGVTWDAGRHAAVPAMDLLNMSRPKADLPWAYVKIAEGCDRSCGYCAIPQFRGPQRSRSVESICEEVEKLDVREVVLVAQDLANFGRDASRRDARRSGVKAGKVERPIVPLLREIAKLTDWVRLLYLYPADLTDELIEAIFETDVPYFDLSLQHVSRPLLRRMRRWGDGDRFLDRIQHIHRQEPAATFRSNFIVGYPGETEEDHEQLLEFVEFAQLDWCAFFAFSSEDGTYAAGLSDQVPAGLITERLAELREAQDAITEMRRSQLIGQRLRVLVDAPGIARSHREAPEIDGVIHVPASLPVGEFAEVEVVGAAGPDLMAETVLGKAVPAETVLTETVAVG